MTESEPKKKRIPCLVVSIEPLLDIGIGQGIFESLSTGERICARLTRVPRQWRSLVGKTVEVEFAVAAAVFSFAQIQKKSAAEGMYWLSAVGQVYHIEGDVLAIDCGFSLDADIGDQPGFQCRVNDWLQVSGDISAWFDEAIEVVFPAKLCSQDRIN